MFEEKNIVVCFYSDMNMDISVGDIDSINNSFLVGSFDSKKFYYW